MRTEDPDRFDVTRAVVIGAGFGGLAAAVRLRAAGLQVTLLDQHAWVGGKARTVDSANGPVDAGPTVLTLRGVFDDLFQAAGTRLDDHVTLMRDPVLARHFWPGGARLDLFDDRDASADAIAEFAGAVSADEFRRFAAEAEELFGMFEAPMMHSADPVVLDLAKTALRHPRHLRTLSPFARLAGHLKRRFSDPRLRQLFARYATYVGGSPLQSPALLSLIWRAEETGVYRVQGGMHRLARAIGDCFSAMGGAVRLGVKVASIDVSGGRVTGVTLADGTVLAADVVVFNGDPRALATGLLGTGVAGVAGVTTTTPRSLSARVWSFAADLTGPIKAPALAHHNVFFAADPREEFDALRRGHVPKDPTLYLCAQGENRFEIILNAAPLTKAAALLDEAKTCRQLTFPTLERFGVTFAETPETTALATPAIYKTLFPGSAGALYGQSPHGMTAALKRPRARTAIRGLYLAGGGTHPGAGVPMAALSGKHAAEAIVTDRVLI